jgi:hypothetical protein
MAKITIYNSQKSRLETIECEFTDKNTTWFDDCVNDQDIHMIADVFDGLLIRENGYGYPIWIDGVSRDDIEYNKDNALKLKSVYIESV